MSPKGAGIWTLGPQWVGQFEGGLEAVALLKKILHSAGEALRSKAVPNVCLALCFLLVAKDAISQLPALATKVCCLPPAMSSHHDGPYPSRTNSQDKLLSP